MVLDLSRSVDCNLASPNPIFFIYEIRLGIPLAKLKKPELKYERCLVQIGGPIGRFNGSSLCFKFWGCSLGKG